MTLWTIQTIEAWNILERTGLLRTDLRYVDKTFLPAYQWLAEQMRMRIGPPPTDGALPVWAWYQWQWERRKKPDLRFGGHLPKEKRGVRIELAVDDKVVLLSDFELWHYVLNYWYLPASEEEGDRFDAALERRNLSYFQTKPLPDPKFHQAIVASWQRIFDVDWAAEGLAEPRAKKSIQATLWEVRLGDVRGVQEFIAR